MVQMIEANWMVFIAVLLLGIAVALWLFARGSTSAKPREHKPDVMDEGAAPAQRNQALIDAPLAPELMPMAGAGTMAGVAEIVAVAAQDEVEAAQSESASAPASAQADETPPSAEPQTQTRPASESAAADDLSKLKGVGPKLVALLATLGVTRYAQIAAWTEEDIDHLDAQLGNFKGRIRRDSWVEQAKLLSAGDVSGYEAKYGKL